MMNQAGSSRMDTVLKMLLIAFISLLAFSSGVYFGKQMSDSDYQLKALESDFHGTQGKQAGRAKDTNMNDEDAIHEEEVAALSDKYVNAERGDVVDPKEETGTDVAAKEDTRKVASAHDEHGTAVDGGHQTDPAPKAHGDSHAAKPDLSAAQKAANRIANNSAPTEAPQPSTEPRMPNSLPKTVGPTPDVEFTVQVASYPTADAAKAHANELVKKGFPAFPVEATIGGRTWFRVSVGSFKTMKEATSYRAQLIKQAEVQSAIVQRIQR